MSNYGLEKFLNKEKIRFSRSKVGDRYVKEKMKKLNYNLGGEQSGHIILGKFATTGDGLLVALEVLFSLFLLVFLIRKPCFQKSTKQSFSWYQKEQQKKSPTVPPCSKQCIRESTVYQGPGRFTKLLLACSDDHAPICFHPDFMMPSYI